MGNERRIFRTGPNKIGGVFLVCDKRNLNGRVYPKEVVARAISKFTERVEAKKAVGMIGMSDFPYVDLSAISHRIDDVWFERNLVVCTATVLKTPMGNTLLDMLSQPKIVEGLAFATQGMAHIEEKIHWSWFQRKKYFEVQSNFELTAINIVTDPS